MNIPEPKKEDLKEKKFCSKEILISLLGVLLILGFIYFCKYQISQDIFSLGEHYKWTEIIYFLGFGILIWNFVYAKFESSKIITLFLILALIIFSYPLISPFNTIYDRDSLYALQDMSLTIESGYRTNENISGYASDYNLLDGFPLTNIISSIAMGLPLETSLLFLPFLIQLFLLTSILFLFFNKFFSKEFAFVALLLFFISSRLNHIHYETLAQIFLVFTLYSLYSYHRNSSKRNLLLILFFAILTFFTHHITSYILLFILLAYIFIRLIQTKRNNYLIFIGFGLLIFIFLFAKIIYANLAKFSLIFKEVFINFASINQYWNQAFFGFNFNLFEVLFAIGFFMLLVITLFYTSITQKVDWKKYSFFIFCTMVLLSFFSLFLFTKGITLFLREMPLILFGLSPLFFYFYTSLKNKKLILFLFLFFLLIGGSLLSYGSQQRRLFVTPDSISINSELLVDFEFIHAGDWAERELNNEYKALGSDLIFGVIGPYGQVEVERYSLLNNLVYLMESNGLDSFEEEMHKNKVGYIYFEQQLLDYKNTFSSDGLNSLSLEQLNSISSLNQIYTTNNINLFYLN